MDPLVPAPLEAPRQRRADAAKTTLGETVRRAREAAGVSLVAFAEKTRIQTKYLAAFEADDYKNLPEPVYQRLFIKTIAGSLGLSDAALLALHEAGLKEKSPGKSGIANPPAKASPFAFLVMPRLLSIAGVVFAGLAALGVLGFEIQRIVTPPALAITAPRDQETSPGPSVTVEGKTEAGVELRVNGELVYLDRDGSFKEPINLHRGLNLIKITAKKKHSDERVLYRRVLWNGPEAESGGGTAAADASQ